MYLHIIFAVISTSLLTAIIVKLLQVAEPNVIIVYKPIGMTPADMVKIYKEKYPTRRVAFSGRLDPMAHGYMHILFDEAMKNSDYYNGLSKTYQFKVLVNFYQTDTTDILGMIEKNDAVSHWVIVNQIVNQFLSKTGKQIQKYHCFSSFSFRNSNGERHPLWYYKINNRLSEVNPYPSKEITIDYIKHIDLNLVKYSDLLNDIIHLVGRCKNHPELRVDKILSQWNNLLDNQIGNEDKGVVMLTFEAHVTSGTYIRQLVKDVSNSCNVLLCVYEINRLPYS